MNEAVRGISCPWETKRSALLDEAVGCCKFEESFKSLTLQLSELIADTR